MEKQPSGKNVCLHETQCKIIFSKEIIHPTEDYEYSIAPPAVDADGVRKNIHCICSTGMPGIIQVRSVDCCCHACIRMAGHCEVKHADPWITFAIDSHVDVAKMKKSHWDNFTMPPNMNPRMRYPVMENTKIKKRKTVHNIEEMNVEDEDDIPLSKLRRTDGVTDNKQDAAVTGFVTENGGMTENKED